MDKELDNFKELINNLIGKKELMAALKKIVDSMDERHEKEKAQILHIVEAALIKFKEDTATDLNNYKAAANQFDTERATTTQQQLSAALSQIQSKIEEVNAKLAEVKSGVDGKDADEEAILQKAIDYLTTNLPMFAQAYRDGLETLQGEERIKIEAIDGLKETLEDLTKKVKKAGGSSQMLVNHWPIHESFTMDGVATTVTLSQAPGAAGNAIFGVRYQGQTLDMTTHYTVSGNKITLVGITPSSGDIISVTYMA